MTVVTVPFLQSRAIRLKVTTRFPALILGGTAITVAKANGNYFVNTDYSSLNPVSAIPDAPHQYVLMWDNVQNAYALTPISLLGLTGGITDAPSDSTAYGRINAAWQRVLLLAGGTMTGPIVLSGDPTTALQAATKEYVDNAVARGFVPTEQIITAPGNVTVATTDGLIILNKTVGQATSVFLPAASTKIGAVKIVDWKGDANVNNITIIPNGSDLISGMSQWVLGGGHASVDLDPVVGTINGYAV
jgi:hypothetical protein